MKTALAIRYNEAPIEVMAVTGMSRVALWPEFFKTETPPPGSRDVRDG